MQKDSFVSIRVSKETKNEATRILGNYGYTLSSYINVLLSELVKNGYPQLELIKALAKEKNKSLLTFDEIKELVLSLCKDNDHILSAYLFGSYSRGEATGESDIDVHIVSDGTMSLVDLIDFENRLSRLSGKKVDAVGSVVNSSETDFVKTIKDKEIKLYEKGR